VPVKIFTYNRDDDIAVKAFQQMEEERTAKVHLGDNDVNVDAIVEEIEASNYDSENDELLFVVHPAHADDPGGNREFWTKELIDELVEIYTDPVIRIVFFHGDGPMAPVQVDFIYDMTDFENVCDRRCAALPDNRDRITRIFNNINAVSINRDSYRQCHFQEFLREIDSNGRADLRLLTQRNACEAHNMVCLLSQYLILLAHESLQEAGNDSPFDVGRFQFQDTENMRQELYRSFRSTTQAFSEEKMIIYPLGPIGQAGEEDCLRIKASFRRLRHCWLETTLDKDFDTNASWLRKWIQERNKWEALERDSESKPKRKWVCMLNEFKKKLVECYSPCQLVNKWASDRRSVINRLTDEQKLLLSATLNDIYNRKVTDWKCRFEERADALGEQLESFLESCNAYRKDQKDQNEQYFDEKVLGRWRCLSSKAKSLHEVLKALPGEGVLIP